MTSLHENLDSLLDTELKPVKEPPESEWTKHLNDQGKAYYYNKTTKETQWKLPEMYAKWNNEELKPKLKLFGWRKTVDKKGKPYYYHVETKETRWELPDIPELQRYARLLDDLISNQLSPPPTDDKNHLFQRLSYPDSILESKTKTMLVRLISKHNEDPLAMISKVRESYVGIPRMVHIVAEWISLAEKLGEDQHSENSSNSSKDYKAQTDDKYGVSGSGDDYNEAERIIMSRLGKLLYDQFNRSAADEMVGHSTAVPQFLTDMITDSTWRKLLIELLDANRDSVLLKFCLRQISDGGHHREIAQIIHEVDYFDIFDDLVVKMSLSVVSANTNIHDVAEDLKRMCYYSDYLYFYAEKVLLTVEKNLNVSVNTKKRTLECSSDSHLGWKCKVRRLRQELDNAAIWRVFKNDNVKRGSLDDAESFVLRYTPLTDPKNNTNEWLIKVVDEIMKILRRNSVDAANIEKLYELLTTCEQRVDHSLIECDDISIVTKLRHPKILMLLVEALIGQQKTDMDFSKVASILSLICCLDNESLNLKEAKSETTSMIVKSIIQCRNDCLGVEKNLDHRKINNLRSDIKSPIISSIILCWISRNVFMKEDFPDLLRVFLQLIQEISVQHALKRGRCFDILKNLFRFCERRYDWSIIRDVLDCMMDVLVTGYSVLPMKFFQEIIPDQDIERVKYIIQSILDSVEPPISPTFRVCLQNLFGMDACKKIKLDDLRNKKCLSLMHDDTISAQLM